MTPTEALKKEHRALEVMLSIMEKICLKLESEADVSHEHLDKIVEFFKVFADKCHHGKEEDILFPAMNQAGIPNEGGPIAVMLREHEIGRGYIRNLAEAVIAYHEEVSGASSRIIENMRNFIALLSQHIDKEDNILYPMADQLLTEEKQTELVTMFENVEKNVIGDGKHEEFHALLDHLSEVYLSQN